MNSLKSYISIRKGKSIVKATDETVHQIVKDALDRFGNDADLNHIDVSQCTDLSSLFYDAHFTGDVSKWDVSNVTDFEYCFCSNPFDGDLSNWDMSSAVDLNSMFNLAPKFKGTGLKNWSELLKNVKSTSHMFDKCQNLDGHELENWKFSTKLEKADYMFSHCENLKCDLSKWDLTHIKKYEDIANMCFRCKNMSYSNFPKTRFMKS